MNLLLFAITIIASFIVVRIGAIAFEITGLEWSLAKFQALSCFSGTGFTTRESELITKHPQRRQIATVLMIFGNAGLVTLIATFANSLNPNSILPELKIPFVDVIFPKSLIPLANFIIVIAFLYFIYRFFSNANILKYITDFLKDKIIKNTVIKPVSVAELVSTTGDYGVLSVNISDNSSVIGKTLIEADLRKKDINVLVIERDGDAISNPSPRTKIEKDDRLICFGNLESMKQVLTSICPDEPVENKDE